MGIVLTFLSSAGIAFALYQMVYFMNPGNRWWSSPLPEFSYSFGVVILMLIAMIVTFKSCRENKIFQAPPFKWIFLILLCYFFIGFDAAIPSQQAKAFDALWKLVITLAIAYKLIGTPRALDYVLHSYIMGSAYIGYIAYSIGRNSGDRVEGIGTVDANAANTLAAAIAPSLILCLYYFWVSNSKLFRAVVAVAGVFIVNAIVLINSRGSMLGIAVGGGFFLWCMYTSSMQKKYQRLAVIAILCLGSVAVVNLVDDKFIDRMKTMTNTEVDVEQESGATRFVFWQSAIEFSFDFPFGVGARGFEAYSDDYLPQDLHTGASRARAVHSTWFEALTEIGYPGLFFLVCLILSCYRCTYRCKRVLRESGNVDEYFKIIALEAALICFLVIVTFINRLRAEVFYWLILYISVAYNLYVLKRAHEHNDKDTDLASSVQASEYAINSRA